eukprot:1156908-Pelagomonas_calceolata.AAC.3
MITAWFYRPVPLSGTTGWCHYLVSLLISPQAIPGGVGVIARSLVSLSGVTVRCVSVWCHIYLARRQSQAGSVSLHSHCLASLSGLAVPSAGIPGGVGGLEFGGGSSSEEEATSDELGSEEEKCGSEDEEGSDSETGSGEGRGDSSSEEEGGRRGMLSRKTLHRLVHKNSAFSGTSAAAAAAAAAAVAIAAAGSVFDVMAWAVRMHAMMAC